MLHCQSVAHIPTYVRVCTDTDIHAVVKNITYENTRIAQYVPAKNFTRFSNLTIAESPDHLVLLLPLPLPEMLLLLLLDPVGVAGGREPLPPVPGAHGLVPADDVDVGVVARGGGGGAEAVAVGVRGR